MYRKTLKSRPAFTILEMLVATALTLFIMSILATAFVTSLGVFSGLKAIGDMQTQLRTAINILRDDMAQDHFEGKRRLSESNYWKTGFREGFIAVRQASAKNTTYMTTTTPNPSPPAPGYFSELPGDVGLDNVESAVATDHALHMFVRKRGNRRDAFFSAQLPAGSKLLTSAANYVRMSSDAMMSEGANTFNSPCAEVAYFLKPTVPGPNGTTQLYALYRSQFVVVLAPDDVNLNNVIAAASPAGYLGMACNPSSGNLRFWRPADLTNINNRTFDITTSQRRFGTATNVPPDGATLVLTDVISFQVQLIADGPSGVDSYDLPSIVAGGAPYLFDSSAATTNVYGIKVTIRVWDRSSELTRQMTLVQDL